MNYPLFSGLIENETKGRYIGKRTPDIEFEQDWSVGLSATLGGHQKIKVIFLVPGIFLGKADSVIFLGFECIINPQNLIKIVRAIFEKNEILIFFT